MTDTPSSSSTDLSPPPLPAPNVSVVENPATHQCDVVVAGIFDDRSLTPTVRDLDKQLGGVISRLLEQEKLSTDIGEAHTLAGPADGGADLVHLVGLGPREQADRETAFRAASSALRQLSSKSNSLIVVSLAECFDPSNHDVVVSGAVQALESQSIYRSEPKSIPNELLFSSISADSLSRGMAFGESINLTRRLVNEPASEIFPASFAARAEAIAADCGLQCEIWDEQRLAAENCRAILAVGAGSTRPPRLLVLRYNGDSADAPPLALVGKGVTFDSGGLSIKPSDGMVDMKCDMAGAATVVGTMQAIAKLGIKKNVIGLCGLAENMVSGSSYKLGDVIKTRSGKTIEILNTDAEGRVVLADTLNVAVEMQPSSIIDLATLTGACMVALGMEVAGVMSNDQTLCDAVIAAGRLEGEPLWQLPMFDLYNEKVKSKVADIKNIGEGRWGGAITAAKFLENFVDDIPWVHLDIAGPAFADSAQPYRDAGATGAMLRTLVRWIETT